MKVFDKHIYVCMYAFVFIYIYNVKKRFGYYGKTHKEYKRKSGQKTLWYGDSERNSRTPFEQRSGEVGQAGETTLKEQIDLTNRGLYDIDLQR